MPAMEDLKSIIAALDPVPCDGEIVFVTISDDHSLDVRAIDPIATCVEPEGLTLVIRKRRADEEGLEYDGVFRQITLRVHSALHSVGLTAAVTSELARNGISANVIAAYYHDHIFVPSSRLEEAVELLVQLSKNGQ